MRRYVLLLPSCAAASRVAMARFALPAAQTNRHKWSKIDDGAESPGLYDC